MKFLEFLFRSGRQPEVPEEDLRDLITRDLVSCRELFETFSSAYAIGKDLENKTLSSFQER